MSADHDTDRDGAGACGSMLSTPTSLYPWTADRRRGGTSPRALEAADLEVLRLRLTRPPSRPRDLALARVTMSSRSTYAGALASFVRWLSIQPDRRVTHASIEQFMWAVSTGQCRGPSRSFNVMLAALHTLHLLDPRVPDPQVLHRHMAAGSASLAPPTQPRRLVPAPWIVEAAALAHLRPDVAILWICLGAALRGNEWRSLVAIEPQLQAQHAIVRFSHARKRHVHRVPLGVSSFLVPCWQSWIGAGRPTPDPLRHWGFHTLHNARATWASIAYRVCLPEPLIAHHLQHHGTRSLQPYFKEIAEADLALIIASPAVMNALFTPAELQAAGHGLAS
jgi:hypothetical protein